MRTIHRIDSSYPIDDLIDFCKKSEQDDRPAAENMSYEDWENKPHTFLYLLYKEKRFDGPKNGYLICKEDGNVICGHGFYLSEIEDMICCGSRGYTILGAHCAHTQGDMNDMVFDIARSVGVAGCFFSFNEYNMRFIDGYKKINDPQNFPRSYQDEAGQWWSKHGRKIYPVSSYGPIMLKGAKQWILYHLWDLAEKPKLLEKLRKFDWNEES